MAGFRKRFLASIGSAASQMIFAQGATLVTNLLLARWFGPHAFGLYSAGATTLNSAGQVAQLATASVGSRYLGQWFDHDQDRALAGWNHCRRKGLTSGVIVATVLLVSSPLMARWVFGQVGITPILAVAALGAFFVVASQQLMQAFMAVERSGIVTLASVLSGTFNLTVTLLCGHFFGPIGAISGVCATYAFTYLLLSPLAGRTFVERPDAPAVTKEEERVLREQLIPAGISGILLLPSTWLLLTLVTASQGAAEAGVYSAATQFRLLFMTFPQIANTASIVIINRAARTESSDRVTQATSIGLLVLGAVCAGLGYFIAPFFMDKLGHAYHAAVPVVRVLLIAVVLESAILVARQRLQARGEFKQWLLQVTVPWQVATLGAAFVCVPRWGAVGAAWSYAFGLAAALSSLAVFRMLRIAQPSGARS